MTTVTADFNSPDYAYWRAALVGQAPGVEADKPQCGFYSRRWMAEGRVHHRDPVAIYRNPDNGEITATVWRTSAPITEALWLSIASHPITDDVFWDTVDRGEWADTEGLVEPPAGETSSVPGADVTIPAAAFTGSNQPPDEVDPKESITERVRDATKVLEELLRAGITNQAAADRLANSKDRLKELWGEADNTRKKEKKPHDTAAANVQTRWRPVLASADEGYQKAQGALTVWQKAERKRLEAAAAEAARVAEEARRQHEQEALAAVEAGREPPPPPDEPAAIVDTRPRAGGAISGRRTGLREVNAWAEVDDWSKLLDALATNDAWQLAVRELAQEFANRAAKARAPLAGTRRITDEKAV